MLCARSLVLVLFLVVGMAVQAQQTRTLRIGGQAVTLTSDKRSAPALVVQMPEGDRWYGFLTSGTAPGRLTVQMPGGQIHSLVAPPPLCPPGYSCTAILDDYPQIYTWNGGQHGLPNLYNGFTVQRFNGTEYDNALGSSLGGHPAVYPTYWIQAMCSNTTGTFPNRGNPVHSSTGRHCWCRLKQRATGANGRWVFLGSTGGAAANECAIHCPNHCEFYLATLASFRPAMLSAFTNP